MSSSYSIIFVIRYVDSFSKIAVVLSNGALLLSTLRPLFGHRHVPAGNDRDMEFGRARINGYRSEKLKIQLSINKGGGPYYPH
ncbi:hypothetical protein [Saccharococcus thermophilus]|uniref:hypothetical protein n=1 Tax=Saccharococcus thermophilus TaxID=29396 RepID=UPI0036D40368